VADPNKMRIEIVTGHCLGGEGNDVYPGEIIEAPGRLTVAAALEKVRQGYARIVHDLAESGPAELHSAGPGPMGRVVLNRDPQIEVRDPETPGEDMPPKRRRKTGGR
jgi:hypothetical protein